jgi:hypothetical protein
MIETGHTRSRTGTSFFEAPQVRSAAILARHPAVGQASDPGRRFRSLPPGRGAADRDGREGRFFDNGRTLEKLPHFLGTPYYHETDGPMVRMKDGSVLVAVNGRPNGPPDQAGIFRSTTRGETWELLAAVKADHDSRR